jgi:prolipoprotein diacylglyceryltransferase
MLVPDTLQIGPIHVQTELLALLIGFVVGIGLIRARLKRSVGAEYGDIPDILLNCGLIVLLFWKLGVVLTSPLMILQDPLKLLFITGSTTEILLGICAALFFGIWQLRKKSISIYTALDVISIGAVTAAVIYYALVSEFGRQTELPWGIGVEGTLTRFHPVHAYFSILLIPLWFRLFRSYHLPGTGQAFKATLLYFGIAGMLVSILDDTDPSWLYISYAQIIFILMMVLGWLLPNRNIAAVDPIEKSNRANI